MAPIFKTLAIFGALFAALGSAIPLENTARAPSENEVEAGPQGGCTKEKPCVGQGTFYSTAGIGACGSTNDGNSQNVFAVSKNIYNRNLCGRTVNITYKGKQVSGKIVDRCEACKAGDLDFSPHAFKTVADPLVGRLDGVSWYLS